MFGRLFMVGWMYVFSERDRIPWFQGSAGRRRERDAALPQGIAMEDMSTTSGSTG
jgi:hypothetical protein